MKILLHTCCAPCATYCLRALRERGDDVILFYSNANIAPHAEFLRRLEAVRYLADALDTPLLVDEPDHNDWLASVARGFEQEPETGARCTRCFHYSLARTVRAMHQQRLDAFTTTLTVSPHKRSATLFETGRAIDPEHFLAIDFKKNDGFKQSLALAAKHNLYRQNFCGCEFSRRPPALGVEIEPR